jgi:hypothetical protein
MEAKRKVASYAVVAAAAAYAVIYIAFLQGIPQTYYVFTFATILDLVAMPILLFALGLFLMHKLRPDDAAPRTPEQRTRAHRALIIAIVALYALYVMLSLVARLQSGQVATSLIAILTVIFYVIEYGGFFVGLLYGMFA